ncbi:uncharacterized protein LOC131207409 [Anopheles bellator]|uniref:uncharacterized protein LOC131207409 n=1 Tax=Anopheles bellator TaxID=139047 RepID=UPI002647E2AD|nr:uncharacterized protein LOC131207409 [Anopheles bellator]
MSILLQESSGGNGGTSSSASASSSTPVDSGDLTPAIDASSKDGSAGECKRYGISWKRCLELLAQKTVIDSCLCGCVQIVSPEEASTGGQICEAEPHDKHLFPVKCCCRGCLVSREMVMQLYAEDCQYNSLWERLQLLMKQYYDLIPESEDNALYNLYMELMAKSSLKWLTDARFNSKNMIQVSLASNLPLSNEMTFVMLSTVLSTRDPHQLLELLCFQLRSIVQAYCVGFEELTSVADDGRRYFNPPDVLNYILDGYEKLCQAAHTVAPLLMVLEQCHLGKFELNWRLINQRIFQRYFYFEVKDVVPDCIIRLRDALPDREYRELADRFALFDEEMRVVTQEWSDTWPLLHNYHKAPEDCERRKRINSVYAVLMDIRESNFVPQSEKLFESPDRPMAEWLELEDRSLVWEYVVHCLKTKWVPCMSSRLTTVTPGLKCRTCFRMFYAHAIKCQCQTCIIGGGIYIVKLKKDQFCPRCSCLKSILEKQHSLKYLSVCENIEGVMINGHQGAKRHVASLNGVAALENGLEEVMQPPDLLLGETQDVGQTGFDAVCKEVVALGTDQPVYHIAWATFKHLRDRVSYASTTLEPLRVCAFQTDPCPRVACRVAIQMLGMQYPVNLTNLLLKSYKPLNDEGQRVMATNWNVQARHFLRKLCDDISKRPKIEPDDQMYPLVIVDMLWASTAHNTSPSLSSARASELAEWFMYDTEVPARNVLYQYFTKFFFVKDGDIELDTQCFLGERVMRQRGRIMSRRLRETVLQKLHLKSTALLTSCPSSLLLTASSPAPSSSLEPSEASSRPNRLTNAVPMCSLSMLSAACSTEAAASTVVTSLFEQMAVTAAAACSFIEPLTRLKMDSETQTQTCQSCNQCLDDVISKTDLLDKQRNDHKLYIKGVAELLKDGLGMPTPRCEVAKAIMNVARLDLEPKSKKEETKPDSTPLVTNGTECRTETENLAVKAVSSATTTTTPSEVAESTDPASRSIVTSKKAPNGATPLPTRELQQVPSSQAMPANNQCRPAVLPLASKSMLNETSATANGTKQPDVPTCCHQKDGSKCTAGGTMTPSNKPIKSDLQTPAKLSAFAKMAANKLPAANQGPPKSVSNNSSPSSSSTVSTATSAWPKAIITPSCITNSVQQSPPSPAVSTQTPQHHGKQCPCGIPSHAPVPAHWPSATGGSSSKVTAPLPKPVPGGTSGAAPATTPGAAPVHQHQPHSKDDHKPGRPCHRAPNNGSSTGGDKVDGSCVCYYCTLFGQSVCLECNHNQRTNETRDRLRKKVKQLQSSKEQIQKQQQQQQQTAHQSVDQSSAGLKNDKVALGASTAKPAAGGGNKSGTPAAATEKVPVGGHGPKDSTALQGHKGMPQKNDKKAASAKTPEPLQSIEDILRFIEGDDNKGKRQSVPDAKPGSAAAGEKKVKKKHKKHEQKMIAQLEDLREQFYACQREEQKALMQFQTKLSKKDQKLLRDNIQAFRLRINELHGEINTLVGSIRSSIPDFPFRLDAFAVPSGTTWQEAAAAAASTGALEQQSTGGPAATMPPFVPSNMCRATFAKLQETLSLIQQQKQLHLQHLQHHQQSQNVLKQQHRQALDLQQLNDAATRQMVTIKRTFLPHAEAQVTVTAKGESPDMDQVLYTFVNGQLIPAEASAASTDGAVPAQHTINGQLRVSDTGTKTKAGNGARKMDPLVELSQQEQRLIEQYLEQLQQQPSTSTTVEEPTKRSSRSKKKFTPAAPVPQQQQQNISCNDLLHERILRQSVELMQNLQIDRKGDTEMLMLANKVRKNLLEMQTNPSKTMDDDTTSDGDIRCVPVLQPSVGSAASDTKKPTAATEASSKAASELPAGKSKKKKERKKDKLIDEIDEIVARLNLLDSDEEEGKPTGGKGKKAVDGRTGVNRKQSKDSIVSGGSGGGGRGQNVKELASAKPTQSAAHAAANDQQKRSQAKSNQSSESTKHQRSSEAAQKKQTDVGEGLRPSTKGARTTSLELNKAAVNKDRPKEPTPPVVVEPPAAAGGATEPTARKKLNKTFIDPEFDNNTFRLLNLDESESEVEEVLESVEATVPVAIDTIPAIVVPPASEKETTEPTPRVEDASAKKTKKKPKDSSLAAPKATTSVDGEKDKGKQSRKKAPSQPESGLQSNQNKGVAKDDAVGQSAVSSTAEVSKTKKLTPAQSMVEKISALLDSPGLSNRQRKQMIRQLEQAQAIIQSQLLQNSAKTAKAKLAQQQQQQQLTVQGSSGRQDRSLNSKQTASNTGKLSKEASTAAGAPKGSKNQVSGSPVTMGSGISVNNNNLMDQLSRGVRVEGLNLPPGITLTRVDPSQAEALKAKRDSIRKICEPLKPIAPNSADPSPLLPGQFVANPLSQGMFVVNPMATTSHTGQKIGSHLVAPSVSGQDSVIMVNTGKLNVNERQTLDALGGGDRKRRNKRRNKNKSKDQETYANDNSAPTAVGSGATRKMDGNNIVTLRNPMFQGLSAGAVGPGQGRPGGPMMPDVQGARMTLGYDQPATIFKNDNGMFTIRNPALHHALSGGAPPEASGFRPFNAAYLVENGIMPPTNVSFASSAAPLVTAAVSTGGPMATGNVPTYLQQRYPPPPTLPGDGMMVESGMEATGAEPRKCKSVIGSEMKNAQKHKQQQQQHLQHQRPSGTLPVGNWQHLNGSVGPAAGTDLYGSSATGTAIGSDVVGQHQRPYSSFDQYSLNAGYGGMMAAPSAGYYQSVGATPVVGCSAIGSERSHGLYLGGTETTTSLNSIPHCCDDDSPSAFFKGSGLGLAGPTAGAMNRYDDMSFLQSLQPGQRLNSEVTIHTINESKMLRQQAQNLSNDIEITRITAPMSASSRAPAVTSTGSAISLQQMMQFKQHEQQLHLANHSPGSRSIGSSTGAGAAHNDFMDSRSNVSCPVASSVGSEILASASHDMDAKRFLREYQLGQLQQQMQELQIQPSTNKQQLEQPFSSEFGDTMFTPNRMHNVNDLDADSLESMKRLNYYFTPANSGKQTIGLGGSEFVSKSPASSASHSASSSGEKLSMSDGSTTLTTATVSGGLDSRRDDDTNTTGHSLTEDGNPGGVSMVEELERPQQPPIGTPSSKSLQLQRLQQNGGSVSTTATIINYPATADSPASSLSLFDGISSSLSSQAHSFDDLYNGLLTVSPTTTGGGTSAAGCINLNENLSILQPQQQSNSDPTVSGTGSVAASSNGPSETVSLHGDENMEN